MSAAKVALVGFLPIFLIIAGAALMPDSCERMARYHNSLAARHQSVDDALTRLLVDWNGSVVRTFCRPQSASMAD